MAKQSCLWHWGKYHYLLKNIPLNFLEKGRILLLQIADNSRWTCIPSLQGKAVSHPILEIYFADGFTFYFPAFLPYGDPKQLTSFSIHPLYHVNNIGLWGCVGGHHSSRKLPRQSGDETWVLLGPFDRHSDPYTGSWFFPVWDECQGVLFLLSAIPKNIRRGERYEI